MSVKKSLTVAGLAALLAVPAFGATSASRVLHTSSITAHAATDYHDTHTDTVTHGTYVNGQYEPVGTPVYSGHDQSAGTGYIGGILGSPNGNAGYIRGADLDNGHAGDSEHYGDSTLNAQNNTDSSNDRFNGTDTNNTNSNENSQYTSKNSLPQTGEVNHQTSELVASIVLGATGIGLGAMTMKKHKKDKDVASVTPIQTNSSSSNGNNKVDNIIDTLGNEANKLSNYIHQMSNK